VAGALTYTPHRGESMSVAIVQRYVPNQGELRDVLQTALHAYFARVRGRRAPATPPLGAQTVLAYGGDAPSPAVQAVLGEVRTLAQVLGQRTAEMHLTLASDPTAPAFAPVPFTAFYQRALYQAERSRVGRVLAALHKQLPRLPAEAQAQAARLLTLREPLVQRFQQIAQQPIRAQRLRCHGDFHLGQVLVTGADLMLVDFEGQPQQRVSERQLKRSPLVDVASMLWSLQSAPVMALRTAHEGDGDAWPAVQRLAAWAHLWAWWSSTAFVHAYLATAAAGTFLPVTPAALGMVLDHCWLASVVTALHTTLDTQPQWAGVAIDGLLHLVEGPRVRRAHPGRRARGGRPRAREGSPAEARGA
jgi:maltose alpha-D-glucosyltransferase/alpha-amylase